MSNNCDVIAIFLFMSNMEGTGSRIPEAWSVKLAFSFRVTFYITKTENRTKKSLIQL